jgi:hypothetical protein
MEEHKCRPFTKEIWMYMNDFECISLREGRPNWKDGWNVKWNDEMHGLWSC